MFNQGVCVEKGDYDDRTPLHLASAGGHLECVKFLIEEGVKPNPKDRWGATPLNDAKTKEVQEYLESKSGERGIEQPSYSELTD